MATLLAESTPPYDYAWNLNKSFNFTHYGHAYLYSGSNYIFETRKADPSASDPVMYLFNYNDPINNGSWSDDDGNGGYQSRISCTPQVTGWYLLLLRGYGGSVGTSDLYINDNLVVSNAPLGGKTVSCSSLNKTGELNYFTCHLTGDSRLWLADNTAFPGLIKGFNDDYSGTGDWNWGVASRVKKEFSSAISYSIISSFSSSYPTGICDVYQKCSNSTIMSYFPNLMTDDAIMAAPASGIYNCISWSGGVMIPGIGLQATSRRIMILTP